MLQWGHVFSDVETPVLCTGSGWGSMGFNGATSFQTWRQCEGVEDVAGQDELQWGHVFSDVETRAALALARMALAASMGPRLFRRGDGEDFAIILRGLVASMGPRLFRRGDALGNRYQHIAALGLQWGHVFSDVETNPGER